MPCPTQSGQGEPSNPLFAPPLSQLSVQWGGATRRLCRRPPRRAGRSILLHLSGRLGALPPTSPASGEVNTSPFDWLGSWWGGQYFSTWAAPPGGLAADLPSWWGGQYFF